MPDEFDLDLIWGAKNIAKVLGVTERACFHMLEKNELPARQVGSRWVASREALRQFFMGGEREVCEPQLSGEQ